MFDEAFFFIFIAILAFFLFLGFPIWALILLYSIRNRQDHPASSNSGSPESSPDVEKAVRLMQGNVLHELREMRRELAALKSQPPAPVFPASPIPATPAPPPPAPSAPPEPKPPAAPIPALPARPLSAPPPPPVRASPSPPVPQVESAAAQLLGKAWNWLVVGEEYRRKDVSIEFAVATNWLMRIGVLILVFGLGFFIKYSIDHGYLGPQGRVALSTLAGAAMVAGGLRLFGKRYHLLGQGLAGGGIAVLYFSLFAAGNLFKPPLLSIPYTFGGMILITLASGVMAVRFKSLLIAVLGLLGGYLTPVLLSTGAKNFPVLYGYLLLLGLGMLGVAWKRQWPIVTWLAFVCHSILVGVSLGKYYVPADFQLVMPFLAAFFLLFSTAVFIYNAATRTPSSLLELIGLLLSATVFFAFGYWVILTTWPGQHENAAWLALALSAYYVVHVFAHQRLRSPDKALETVFLGLGAVFLSITLPLLLSKGWLTVTWAMEAMILLWMSRKLKSPILASLAWCLYAIVMGRVCTYDLYMQFHDATPGMTFRAYLAVFAPRLVQFGVPILSLAGAWRLTRGEPAGPGRSAGPSVPLSGSWMPALALTAMYGVLFLYLNFECHRFFSILYKPMIHPGMTLVWIGLGCVILAYRRSLPAWLAGLLWSLLTLAVLVKLLAYDFPAWQPGSDPFRYGVPYTTGFVLVRLLDFAAIIGFVFATFRLFRGRGDLRSIGLAAGWLTLGMLLAYLTLELGAALHAFLPAFQRGGLSLLWAVFAFALLFGGLRNKARSLRLAGLALFAVVVWKIFFFDLADMKALYRIIAFMGLGIVLLLAASLYLKNRDWFESKT